MLILCVNVEILVEMHSKYSIIFLLCICKYVESNGLTTEIYFSVPKGDIYNDETTLTLSCTEHTSIADAFLPFNNTVYAENITIHECRPPTSYSKELHNLNIDTSSIIALNLIFYEQEALTPENFEGLNIKKLSLIMISHERKTLKLFQNNPNFLLPLSNLISLTVSGLQMPALTKNLEELSITDSATVNSWDNCDYLQYLHLSNLDKRIPKWPAKCTQLKVLSLENLSPELVQDIAKNMSGGVANLSSFRVNGCRLSNLPYEILNAANDLIIVNLSDNYLFDLSFSKFPILASLKYLDLSRNKLTGAGLADLWRRVPKLTKLDLGHNEFYRYCGGNDEDDDNGERALRDTLEALQDTAIEILSFSSTYIDISCFKNIRFSNLRYLNLDALITVDLKLHDLPTSNASDFTIDFGSSNFLIDYKETEYQDLRQKNISTIHGYNQTHVTIIMTYILWCDCLNSWLARALHDFPNIFTIPDLRCDSEDGTPILDKPMETMECSKRYEDGCTYRTTWQDGRVVGECKSAKLSALPTPLHGLNMSYSDIDTLRLDLPDTLEWVDLRHNRISRLEEVTAAALFASGRRVWLGDNLLDCECRNALLAELLRHQDQVEDFDSLTCVGSGQPLSSVSMAELCQVPLQASLATAAALVALAVAIVLVVRRYGQAIRMYLYARGVCLPCIRKQELEDRLYEYDAFLSFAHGDETFVREQLLPGLERAGFRVCVHYRDWVVGDWIPTQIMRSVHRARRTIIVLSRHFVRSTWSSLEFRYAVAHAAQAGGLRLLVLVLDDVLDDPLDAELQGYLALNTYVRCDDPWFWDKLRYAMPHYPIQSKSKNAASSQKAPTENFNSETAMIVFSEQNLLAITNGNLNR